MKLPTEIYQAVDTEIVSSDSPSRVGTKQTQIIIVNHLRDFTSRLERLEAGTPDDMD